MGKTVFKRPKIYSPAIYARLTQRADLRLWVTFQSEIKANNGMFEMSGFLACHFGFKVEDSISHLGVPKRLWGIFKSLELESFSLTNYSLDLIYYIEHLKKVEIKSSTGYDVRSTLERKKLKIQVPISSITQLQLSNTILLSLHCMDDDFNSNPDEIITISKIREL